MHTTSRIYQCIVTARQGTVTGNPPRGDPAQITYSFAAVEPGVAMARAGVLPTRRISAGAFVIPAEVGDPCLAVLYQNDLRLFMLTEGIPFKEACP